MQKQPRPKPFTPVRSLDVRQMMDPRFHALAVNQDDRDPPSSNTTSSCVTDLRSQPSSHSSSLPMSTATSNGSSNSSTAQGAVPVVSPHTQSVPTQPHESQHLRRKELQRRRIEYEYHENVMRQLAGCDDAYERAQTQALRSAQIASQVMEDVRNVERTEQQLMIKLMELKKNRFRKAFFPTKTGDAIERTEQKLTAVSWEVLNAREKLACVEKQAKADTTHAEALRHDAQRLQLSIRARGGLVDEVDRNNESCVYVDPQGGRDNIFYRRTASGCGERKTTDMKIGRGRRGAGMRRQMTTMESRRERSYAGLQGFAPARMATADATELRKAALAAAADTSTDDDCEERPNLVAFEENLRSQVEALRLLVKARKYLHQVRKDIWALVASVEDGGQDAEKMADAAYQLKRGAGVTREAGRRIVNAVSLAGRPLPVATLVEAWGVATTFLDLRDVLDLGADTTGATIRAVVAKTVTLVDSVNDVVKESISIQTNSVEHARKRLTAAVAMGASAKVRHVRRSSSFHEYHGDTNGRNTSHKVDYSGMQTDAADEDDVGGNVAEDDMRAMSDLAYAKTQSTMPSVRNVDQFDDFDQWQYVGGTGI